MGQKETWKNKISRKGKIANNPISPVWWRQR